MFFSIHLTYFPDWLSIVLATRKQKQELHTDTWKVLVREGKFMEGSGENTIHKHKKLEGIKEQKERTIFHTLLYSYFTGWPFERLKKFVFLFCIQLNVHFCMKYKVLHVFPPSNTIFHVTTKNVWKFLCVSSILMLLTVTGFFFFWWKKRLGLFGWIVL